MDRIYFDNSSTAFPKAPGVPEAMADMLKNGGYNINRGGYSGAYALENVVFDTRELLCDLFGFQKPANVIFTPSVTYSLNYVIKGFLHSGDHVITTSMEHNAMIRPLVQMQELGVTVDMAQCEADGSLDPQRVEELIRPNTKAVMMLHGSNVCGILLPIREVGEICRRRGLKFVVDTAQTAGVFPIDMAEAHIDALCFTGHKGLRGPQGIGGFLVTDELASQMTPLIAGGTGSFSDLLEMPPCLPDRFEAGTMDLPGIVGLHAALSYLQKESMDDIRARELSLAQRFYEGVSQMEGLRVVGSDQFRDRAPIVSVQFTERDNGEMSFLLESRYGIMTRCGLHCAPLAHKTLGTFPDGTVRFSFSQFNREDEVDLCLGAIREILAGK